jgi:hypothetical protein
MIAAAAPATPPRANNFVTLTGSVTEPQTTKTEINADPNIRMFDSVFSVAIFNISPSYFLLVY